MMRRRRFMKLMAASAAALVAQPLSQPLAAPAKEQPKPTDTGRPPSQAIRREIASQKKSLADTLNVIRKYPLEPGSGLAYVFRAAKRRPSRGR